MTSVRVRIAPSPTGAPHIGTAWQALFDFVFAKKNNGVFILRLEDTDRARLVPESVDQIKETLHWLGLDYDEGPGKEGKLGPYVQSERLEIYKKHADELIKKGLAYQDDGAIRFKFNKEGKTTYHDLIGDKDIVIDNADQEDFVLLKSDGFPTYNFANVIDDHLMEISHVIRGNEYISSMPKYLQLYKAFNWEPPQFAHLPLLVGEDRSKLSKRNGAKGALEFKEEGYLKEAVINFLALLGWTHPQGKEVFSIEEMIEVFDFKDFNQSSAFFDVKKLDWLNGEYIRELSLSDLKAKISDFYGNKFENDELFTQFVELAKSRMKTLKDFYPLVRPYIEKVKIEKSEKEKEIAKALELELASVDTWDEAKILDSLKKVIHTKECSMKELYKVFTGADSGLPLPQSLEVVGKEKSLSILL